jgi:L-aminopeptidase/D-esterase-like protein
VRPGTVNTDAARLGYEDKQLDAVVLSGGSWYGLSAATGVANAIKEERAKAGENDFIAGVLAAIIYDVGGRRFSRVTPDDALGGAALRSARPGWFPLGARGAGRYAMQGIYFVNDTLAEAYGRWPHSGQGGAFRQVGSTKIAVFTVVNALGLIVGRDGNVVRCGRNTAGTPCPPIATAIRDRLNQPQRLGIRGDVLDSSMTPSGNTTLTLVVTNQKLPWWALNRLAAQVHSSMARAIQPFATQYDGDVLYAVTTDEVENSALTPLDLSTIASEVAWDAVLASVPDLPAAPPATRVALAPEIQRDLAGVYQFPDGGKLTIGADLTGVFTGTRRIYFDVGRRYTLTPVGPDRLLIEGSARDILQVERGAIVLNPGPWNQRAHRQ